ncbi:SDR family oxidoreductase [Tistrella bauzanensis]|uniref:SDR family oxidoreductase n=2 Tax=Geminicoccaceae TaxID=2066434 RepID=A0ABU9YS95_9PROT
MTMQNPMFDLTGKVAVITGSTRGIGKSIAEQMAAAGAKVVISSRKPEPCAAVRAELVARGAEAIDVPCNISSKEDCERLIAETRKAFGRVDILVGNAASNPYYGPAADMPDEAFVKIMTNNVLSNLWLCNQVVPEMKERRDGAIVLISSIAAIRGTPVLGAYAASKAAEAQMVRNLAIEYGPHNIRINAIAPGLIKTDFARALWENPKMRERVEKSAPLHRIGEPEDIGGAAVFLASNAARFITGQLLVIDGGVTVGDTL